MKISIHYQILLITCLFLFRLAFKPYNRNPRSSPLQKYNSQKFTRNLESTNQNPSYSQNESEEPYYEEHKGEEHEYEEYNDEEHEGLGHETEPALTNSEEEKGQSGPTKFKKMGEDHSEEISES